MRKFHQTLLEKSPIYAAWHGNRAHQIVHWLVFVFISAAITANCVTAINASVLSISEQAYSLNAGVISGKSVSQALSHSPLLKGEALEPAQDHILIKFKSTASAAKRQDVYRRHSLIEKSEISPIGVKLLTISPNDTPEEVVQRLKMQAKDLIDFAEVDAIVAPSFIPNDSYYASEWHLPKIQAPQTWDTAMGNTVTVAILDTGVDCAHPDLAAHCLPGWNTYDNNNNTSDVYGHGTAVAGTAAAVGNNGIGVSGVAINSLIMPVRISDTSGYGYSSTVAAGLTWAADHGARAANVSYALTNSSTVASAAKYFISKGGVVSMSMGNSGTFDSTPENPYILSVSATDSSDKLATWSTTGNAVDLAGPGVGIYTTIRGGSYGSGSGTSFSAPIVAAVAALVISANPSLTGDQVQDILKQSADDLGVAGWDTNYGWGRVNANKAVALACTYSGAICGGAPSPDITSPSVPQNLSAAAPDSTKVNLAWSTSTDNVGVTGYKVYRGGAPLASTIGTTYADTGVVASSTYAYSVSAFDAAGNASAQSPAVSVTVPQASAPAVAIISFQVSKKTATTATITWTTNVPTTGSVFYGLTSAGLSLTAVDSSLSISHTLVLQNLAKATKYYYKITATAVDATTAMSPVSTFRTAPK